MFDDNTVVPEAEVSVPEEVATEEVTPEEETPEVAPEVAAE
jgi:hypothetical protein